MPLVSRNSELPAESTMKTYARFQVPDGLNLGKVIDTESVAGVLGGLRNLNARFVKTPEGSMKAASK